MHRGLEVSDAERIKEKLEECMTFVSIEDDSFIYLSLRMALMHTNIYIGKENGKKESNSP